MVPTLLLIFRYGVLSWRYEMLHLILQEGLELYIMYQLGMLIWPRQHIVYEDIDRAILGTGVTEGAEEIGATGVEGETGGSWWMDT